MEQSFRDEFEKTAFVTKGLFNLARGAGKAVRAVGRGAKNVATETSSGAARVGKAVKQQAQYTGKNLKRGVQGKPMLTKDTIKGLDKQKDMKAVLKAKHQPKIDAKNKAKKVQEAVARAEKVKTKAAPKYKSVVPKEKPQLTAPTKKPGFKEGFKNMTTGQKALAGGAAVGGVAAGAAYGGRNQQPQPRPQMTHQQQQRFAPMRRLQ